MLYFVLLYGVFSFFVVLLVTPWLIRFLRRIGLVVKDQNKKDKPLIPISGGLSVLFGIMAGLMMFLFFRTFFYERADIGLVLTQLTITIID